MPHNQELSIQGESKSISVKTILVVEDDTDIGSFLVQAISQETPHHAMLVTDGFQALKALSNISTQSAYFGLSSTFYEWYRII